VSENHSSFLNPSYIAIDEFGDPKTLTPWEFADKSVRQLTNSTRSVTSTAALYLSLVFILAIINASPITFDTADLSPRHTVVNRRCDFPLTVWLVAFSCTYLAYCLAGLYLHFKTRESEEELSSLNELQLRLQNTYRSVLSVFLFIGGVLIMRAESCSGIVFHFSYMVIAGCATIIGIVLLAVVVMWAMDCFRNLSLQSIMSSRRNTMSAPLIGGHFVQSMDRDIVDLQLAVEQSSNSNLTSSPIDQQVIV
jgi:hypothetical protein